MHCFYSCVFPFVLYLKLFCRLAYFFYPQAFEINVYKLLYGTLKSEKDMSQVDFYTIFFHNMGNVIPSPVYEKVWVLQYLYFWVIRLGQCIVMDAICNVTFEGMRKVGAETVRE